MAQWGTLLVLFYSTWTSEWFLFAERDQKGCHCLYSAYSIHSELWYCNLCAKMQHGTTSTIFNSTFDFLHLCLLFVFFMLPPLTESAATNEKQRLKLSFNKIVEQFLANFPWETKKKIAWKNQVSHDHRNDQRRRSDPTGEHGHLPGAVEKEGGSRPKRILRSEVFTLVYMMIYDNSSHDNVWYSWYDDIWYRWGGCFKNKLDNWTWINMFEHVILESF